ncbi:MAG TPA: acetylornithine deacetylase [Gammaproteobacteria bacterium]|nr:acetylornithine deacetylase [Gammaproteobacteria bacterium]
MPVKRPVPELKEMLQGIVAAPSVSSVSPEFDMSNREAASRIAGWLESIGCAVEMQEIPGFPGKFNVIGTLGQGPGGLVLAGHMDTVPFDQDRWESDPFVLTERDGLLHGLGISDMKGFIALAIEAAARHAGSTFAQPLIILATADEESSMSGGRALVAAGRPKARYAVIGEPTSLRPVHMHKGILMEAVRVIGQAGHSSDPALGRNALEGMHRVIGSLLDYRDELQHRHHDPHFSVPVPTLNLGYIKGGDNPNRICPECELHIDIRTLPGMTVDGVRAELQARLRAALADREFALEFHSLFEGVNPLETSASSAIVRAAERLTGHSAEAVAFSTEAPFLQALGMQTVVLGPGDIRVAHQPNESLPLATLNPTLEILDQLIRQFCMTQTAVASL